MLSNYCLWIIVTGSVLTGSPYLKMRPGSFFFFRLQRLSDSNLEAKGSCKSRWLVHGWIHGRVIWRSWPWLQKSPSINLSCSSQSNFDQESGSSHWDWSLNITTFHGLSWGLLLKWSETVPWQKWPESTARTSRHFILSNGQKTCNVQSFLAPVLPGFTRMIPWDGVVCHVNYWCFSYQASDTETNDCPKSFSVVMNPLPI